MRNILSTLFLSLIVFVAATPVAEARRVEAASGPYYGQSYGNHHYPAWYIDEWYRYISPYQSTTHALHPYYRNSYYTRRGRAYPQESSPLFNQYLRDLYYDGVLGNNLPPYVLPHGRNPQQRCYNYRLRRENYRVPAYFEGCVE